MTRYELTTTKTTNTTPARRSEQTVKPPPRPTWKPSIPMMNDA